MPLALNRIIKDPRYRARPSVRLSVSRCQLRRPGKIRERLRGIAEESRIVPSVNARDGDVSLWRIAPRIYLCRFRDEFDSRTSATKKRFSDKQRRSRGLRTSIRRFMASSRQLPDIFRIASSRIDGRKFRAILLIISLIDGFSILITFHFAGW